MYCIFQSIKGKSVLSIATEAWRKHKEMTWKQILSHGSSFAETVRMERERMQMEKEQEGRGRDVYGHHTCAAVPILKFLI